MTNIEQIIKKQEEKLPKLIVDLVWSVTDGGCKLKENQLLSYQEEPVREYEDIINWHSSSIKEILEGVKENIPEKRKSGCGCPPFQPMHDGACWQEEFEGESKGYNKAITDTINHLKSIIKQLKEEK